MNKLFSLIAVILMTSMISACKPQPAGEETAPEAMAPMAAPAPEPAPAPEAVPAPEAAPAPAEPPAAPAE